MNHLKTIAHVCIKSSNLEQTLDFYCGGLGLARAFNFTRQGKVIGFYIKVSDSSFIEVFATDETLTPPTGTSSLHHYCLEVDDMKAVHARLVEKGFKPDEIRMGADNSYQFWITDPSGVHFEFHEYTGKSAQLDASGRDVEVSW